MKVVLTPLGIARRGLRRQALRYRVRVERVDIGNIEDHPAQRRPEDVATRFK